MNGARINTAYGTKEEYSLTINRLRGIGEIPIVLDIKGPELRIKTSSEIALKNGEILKIGKNEQVALNHNVYSELAVGDMVLIDNGRINTRVIQKDNAVLTLLAKTSGYISDGKGVNIPDKKLAIPAITKKDQELMDFAKDNEIEFVALSFTRNAHDVNCLRKSVSGGFKGLIIAKIENSEGVENFQEILEVADGIMVARGDLGVEIEPEKVPLVQKRIIKQCNQKGKLVLTATEMLESMMYNPFPNRAEVSDVANAILDGTDVITLSGETAVGKYPLETVIAASKIAIETEKAVESHLREESFVNISNTISKAISRLCQEMPIDKVVTLTRSGYTARMISRFKIPQPIIAVTPSRLVKKQLELSFGVYPVHIDYTEAQDHILCSGLKLHSNGLILDQDTILFTAAVRTHKKHSSNLIEIHKVSELKTQEKAWSNN